MNLSQNTVTNIKNPHVIDFSFSVSNISSFTVSNQTWEMLALLGARICTLKTGKIIVMHLSKCCLIRHNALVLMMKKLLMCWISLLFITKQLMKAWILLLKIKSKVFNSLFSRELIEKRSKKLISTEELLLTDITKKREEKLKEKQKRLHFYSKVQNTLPSQRDKKQKALFISTEAVGF